MPWGPSNTKEVIEAVNSFCYCNSDMFVENLQTLPPSTKAAAMFFVAAGIRPSQHRSTKPPILDFKSMLPMGFKVFAMIMKHFENLLLCTFCTLLSDI